LEISEIFSIDPEIPVDGTIFSTVALCTGADMQNNGIVDADEHFSEYACAFMLMNISQILHVHYFACKNEVH
jgi:hypothetical protein